MGWIVSDPERLSGAPRVRGTRISIAQLLELLAAGMTIEEIAHDYQSIRGALTELAHSDTLTTA